MPRIRSGSSAPKMGDQLYREPVAYRVQRRTQCRIRSVLVVEAELVSDLVQPFVGLLHRAVQNAALAMPISTTFVGGRPPLQPSDTARWKFCN
jgi:hypothetical protein